MDWAAAGVVFQVVQFLFYLGSVIYLGLKQRSKANKEAIEEIERRVLTLEVEMEKLPGAGDLTKLERSMSAQHTDLKSELSGLAATVRGMGAAVQRIEEYLLNHPQGGGK